MPYVSRGPKGSILCVLKASLWALFVLVSIGLTPPAEAGSWFRFPWGQKPVCADLLQSSAQWNTELAHMKAFGYEFRSQLVPPMAIPTKLLRRQWLSRRVSQRLLIPNGAALKPALDQMHSLLLEEKARMARGSRQANAVGSALYTLTQFKTEILFDDYFEAILDFSVAMTQRNNSSSDVFPADAGFARNAIKQGAPYIALATFRPLSRHQVNQMMVRGVMPMWMSTRNEKADRSLVSPYRNVRHDGAHWLNQIGAMEDFVSEKMPIDYFEPALLMYDRYIEHFSKIAKSTHEFEAYILVWFWLFHEKGSGYNPLKVLHMMNTEPITTEGVLRVIEDEDPLRAFVTSWDLARAVREVKSFFKSEAGS